MELGDEDPDVRDVHSDRRAGLTLE